MNLIINSRQVLIIEAEKNDSVTFNHLVTYLKCIHDYWLVDNACLLQTAAYVLPGIFMNGSIDAFCVCVFGLKHTAVAVIVMTMEGEEDLEEVRDVWGLEKQRDFRREKEGGETWREETRGGEIYSPMDGKAFPCCFHCDSSLAILSLVHSACMHRLPHARTRTHSHTHTHTFTEAAPPPLQCSDS